MPTADASGGAIIKGGTYNLAESNASQPAFHDYALVLFALEKQLVALDRLGLAIAAAHLDASIQQIRMDQVALSQAGNYAGQGLD